MRNLTNGFGLTKRTNFNDKGSRLWRDSLGNQNQQVVGIFSLWHDSYRKQAQAAVSLSINSKAYGNKKFYYLKCFICSF